MVVGYIFLVTRPGEEYKVYDALKELKKELPEIKDIVLLFGEYDIVVRVEAETTEKLVKIIVERIRTLDGVLTTKTYTGMAL
ncbi:MAG: Lrp/AsnC family transcriptional regulator [Thermoplasmata archaeon]|nr:Lrp/AsnC ligand binding domain-containing protein [Thermoplasmata archaeon]RLF30231.1 MAG: Lrp/AsnC family transcriptional regulator [Thermoplasmata archaeon]